MKNSLENTGQSYNCADKDKTGVIGSLVKQQHNCVWQHDQHLCVLRLAVNSPWHNTDESLCMNSMKISQSFTMKSKTEA